MARRTSMAAAAMLLARRLDEARPLPAHRSAERAELERKKVSTVPRRSRGASRAHVSTDASVITPAAFVAFSGCDSAMAALTARNECSLSRADGAPLGSQLARDRSSRPEPFP